MTQFKKIFGILSFCWVSFFCNATDCQIKENINPILKDGDLKEIKHLRNLLKNCPSLQDSLALTNHKIGSIYFNDIDNLDSAIHYTLLALDIRKSLFEKTPNVDLGKSNHNLGVFYNDKGNFKLAKNHLETAIRIYKKINPQRLIYSYLELSKTAALEGEYERSEELLQLVILEATAIEDESSIAEAYLDLGDLYNEKKNYAKAIDVLEKAIKIFEDFGWEEEIGDCSNSIGVAYFNLENYDEAIRNYKISIKAIDSEYQVELAKRFNNLGLAYQKNKQYPLAKTYLDKAMSIAQKIQSNEIIAQSYDNLGELFLAKKEYKQALSNFQKAIQTLLPSFKPNEDSQNPTASNIELAYHKIDLLIYLGDKAKALLILSQSENKEEYLTAALELFHLGDQVIDQLRKEHQDIDTKLFWRKEAIPFYETAIEVCYEMQDVENAFFFFEKSRAILLLEGLQASDALDLIPDNRQTEMQNLQLQLQNTKEEMETALGSKKDSLLKTLVDLQQGFEKKTKSLVKDFPQYYEVKYGTKVVSLSDFQNEFSNDKNKTAIHFFYGEKNIYTITTNAEEAKLFLLGKTNTIESEIRSYLDFFQKSSIIENAPQDFLTQAEKLYSLLLEPLGVENIPNWLIFPDGALAYLPFESLVVTPSDDLGTANYLVKNHVISYGYSASISSKSKNNNTFTNQHSIAAFAPFAENSTNPKYASLAFSNDELIEIKESVDGIFLKNKEANKDFFLKQVAEYSILHLSTHAFSSPTENKPHIVFADTSLYLSELYGLDIDADLVVLSACQSNIGKLSPGEGVMSLGRGFTYAGAKSLVSSLWNANAVSTSRILTDFYKNLQNKTSKDEALHAAKIAYLENENIPSYERSPYYWAGLVFYGDTKELNLVAKKSNAIWMLLTLGLIAIVGFFVGRRFS